MIAASLRDAKIEIALCETNHGGDSVPVAALFSEASRRRGRLAVVSWFVVPRFSGAGNGRMNAANLGHHPAGSLPSISDGGLWVWVRILAGNRGCECLWKCGEVASGLGLEKQGKPRVGRAPPPARRLVITEVSIDVSDSSARHCSKMVV